MIDKRLKANLLFNIIQQFVTLILPLATVPYLARVLGAYGTGVYSYTDAIVQYFILFGTLGLSLYGIRQVAYIRTNPDELSLVFCKILFLRLLFSIISIILFLIYCSFIEKTYKQYLVLQIIALVSSSIDITWLYQGLERFDKVFYRTVALKVISFICIFAFVKSSDDTALYIIIMKSLELISNLFLWVGIWDIIKIRFPSIRSIFSIFGPAIGLFLPQVAIELYVVFDKSMLGWLTTASEVGVYSKAEQFAKLPLSLIAVIGTVVFPRISSLHYSNNQDEVESFLNNCLEVVALLGIGASFGIAGISRDFVPWMLGNEFLDCIKLLYILAPLSFIIGSSSIIGKQYLITTSKEKLFTVITICGAMSNFVLNYALIPLYGAIGACIATLSAETLILIIEIILVRKAIHFKFYLAELWRASASGLIMFFFIRFLGEVIQNSIACTTLQIIIGVIIYFFALYIFNEKSVCRVIKAHIKR